MDFRITSDGRLVKRHGMHLQYKHDRVPSLKSYCQGKLLNSETEQFFYIAGPGVFAYNRGTVSESMIGLFDGANGLKSVCFIWDRHLFVMTGNGFQIYDGKSWTKREPYCPTLFLNSTPYGVGEAFEDINLLNRFRATEYLTDPMFLTFKLPETNIIGIRKLTINGVLQPEAGYSVNTSLGAFTLIAEPPKGMKVRVEYEKDNTKDMEFITTFAKSIFFGGANDSSLFLWGGTSNPCMRIFSAPGNPEFFPACNYSYVGSGDSPITNIVRQYNRQIIFTKNEIFYSILDMSNPLNISYPIYTLNSDIGCDFSDTVRIINNTPMFISDRMLYALVNTTIQDERNISPIGQRIANSLKLLDKDNICTFDDQEKLEFYICSGNICLVYNYKVDAWYQLSIKNAYAFFKLDGVLNYITKDRDLFEEVSSSFFDINSNWATAKYSCFMDLAPIDFSNSYKDKQSYAMYIRCSQTSNCNFAISTNVCNIIPFCNLSVNYNARFIIQKYKILSGRFNTLTLKLSASNELRDTNISEIQFKNTVNT